jgi:GNAT superfamily N-acetyltransferase
VNIRVAASSNDLEPLLDLYRHLHVSDQPSPTRAVRAATWRAILDDPRMRVFVAEEAGQFVASCMLVTVTNLTRGCRPFGLVENVVTRSGYRRRGHGRAVLARALAEAWAAGCYKVMLLSAPTAAARAFYAACGFEAGTKQGFVAFPK